MKRVNTSTKNMGQYAGKWIAILKDRIVAVGETLKEISPLVTRDSKDKTPDEKIAAAFKVPYKGEGMHLSILGRPSLYLKTKWLNNWQ